MIKISDLKDFFVSFILFRIFILGSYKLEIILFQASYEGQTNVADILFGVPSREIGFRRGRNPQRVITYAVTLALKQYNEEYVMY